MVIIHKKKALLFISKTLIVLIIVFSLGVTAFADAARASESVNLRERPTTESKVLKLVPMGYEVEIIGSEGEWTKVRFDGSVGYIKTEYLETVKSSGSNQITGGSSASTTGNSGQNAETESGGALRNGCEGDEVKSLQQLMKDTGHYSGPVNGKFGPLTEDAVRTFQEEKGLTVDGVVGSETLSKLNEKPPEAAADGKVTSYRYGDEGDEIKKIQTALKEKGFYNGPVNGKFGPMTEEAMLSFQKAKGLEVDGIAGKLTLAALYTPKEAAKTETKASTTSAPATASTSAGSDNTQGSEPGKTPVAPNGVELIQWSEAKKVFTIGVTASVYDVWTGITYNVKSFSNGLHADVEPVTKEDTDLLKATYGEEWSWDPRPVWVTINGHIMAA